MEIRHETRKTPLSGGEAQLLSLRKEGASQSQVVVATPGRHCLGISDGHTIIRVIEGAIEINGALYRSIPHNKTQMVDSGRALTVFLGEHIIFECSKPVILYCTVV